MSGHTKGPWEAIPTDPAEGWDGFRIVGEGKANEWGDIGSVTGPQSNPSCVADARLIAAAPDLLEIAQRVLDRGYVSASIDEERGDHADLTAAILKATGAVK